MAYRAFNTETWKDPWFEGLSPEAKLLFIYLWTNDTCNQAGMYQISLKRIEFDVGIKEAEKYLRGELKPKIQWFPEYSVIWVKNFFRYQCANESFAKAAIKSIAQLPKPLQGAFCQYNSEELTRHGVLHLNHGVDTVSTGCQHGEDTHPASGSGSGSGTGTGSDTGSEDLLPSSDEDGCRQASAPAAANADVRPACTPCPQKKIIQLYHEILPELPRVKVWNRTREQYLRSRWREDKERQNLEWWKEFFLDVRKSDFLMGKVPPRNGDTPFMADLEWLIRPSNIVKVLEGRYRNKDPARHTVVSDVTLHNLKAGKAWLEKKQREKPRA